MTNPYAPPQAIVEDIVDPFEKVVLADRGTRLGAAILDGFIFAGLVYLPLMLTLGLNSAAGENGSDTIVLIGSALAMMGFVVWIGLTIRYVLRNGQSIAKKITGIKVVRSDGSPRQSRPYLLAAQRGERDPEHHPALWADRDPLHLRGIAAVHARQARRHHRRQGVEGL